ncbi:MAG TPA: hypothetical protein PKW42_08905, partial [bacterium]|nr:hypothetical protein [bacterium]
PGKPGNFAVTPFLATFVIPETSTQTHPETLKTACPLLHARIYLLQPESAKEDGGEETTFSR